MKSVGRGMVADLLRMVQTLGVVVGEEAALAGVFRFGIALFQGSLSSTSYGRKCKIPFGTSASTRSTAIDLTVRIAS